MNQNSLDSVLKKALCLVSFDNGENILVLGEQLRAVRLASDTKNAADNSGFATIFQSTSDNISKHAVFIKSSGSTSSERHFNIVSIGSGRKSYSGMGYIKSHPDSELFTQYCKSANLPHREFSVDAPESDIIDFIAQCEKTRGGQSL